MAHIALWLRTTRDISTHSHDIGDLVAACGRELQVEFGNPLQGGDVLVFPLQWEDGPDALLHRISYLFRSGFIEDWCAVDVGSGVAWCGDPMLEDEHGADAMTGDDEGDEDQPGGDYETFGEFIETRRGNKPTQTYGAKALFVEIQGNNSRDSSDIRMIESRLSKPVSHLWHGRRSILLAFHDKRDCGEIVRPLMPLLDGDGIVDWTLFELGFRSAGRPGLNAMADFLDVNYRLARGFAVAPRPARAPASSFRDRQSSRREKQPDTWPSLRERHR